MGETTDNRASTAERLARGLALHKQGKLAEARRLYLDVLAGEPGHDEALHLLGVAAYQQGDFDQALARFEAAIGLRPDVAKYHSNRGNALKEAGRLDEAIEAYRRAIAIDAGFADGHFNLGVALRDGGDVEGAARAFQAVLAINPAHLDAKQNLATVLFSLGWNDHAIELFREVLKVRSDVAEVHFNLSQTYEQAGRYVEAVEEARAALALSPGYAAAASALYFLLRQSCSWDGMADIERLIDADIDGAGLDGRVAETPFVNVERSDDAARNWVVARSWGRDLEKGVQPFPAIARASARPDGRLRIGYLSTDMQNHPVAHQMLGLFDRHDRSRFHVAVYSYGRDDGSGYRRRIAASCDAFVDIRGLVHSESARKIRADGIDILVDLTGWTRGHRLAISAYRPAPIHVAYLGFPGTTGCRFIDYAVVDPVVVPPGHAAHFSEALAVLPNTYMATDDRQPIAEGDLSRRDAGLPADGFVFCSFNAAIKIEPVMFDVWMRLLRAVPDGVLWLRKPNDLAADNLRRQAERRGVRPERLVFAGRVADKAGHLRRIRLADLALDTRIYNGHATTCDTLWAGVPVVTLAGRHFASRVSASCLKAVGLDDLVTSSLADYEALALRLARDGDGLRHVRQRLAANRTTFPLFDTALFVRHLEAAYETMWRRFEAGQAPESFAVAP